MKGRLVVTSPEGVSLQSISFIARVSHCPTADESVVVIWSTLVPSKTSRREAGNASSAQWARLARVFPRGSVVRSCARRPRPEGRCRRTWVRASDHPKVIVRLSPPVVPGAAIRRSRPAGPWADVGRSRSPEGHGVRLTSRWSGRLVFPVPSPRRLAGERHASRSPKSPRVVLPARAESASRAVKS